MLFLSSSSQHLTGVGTSQPDIMQYVKEIFGWVDSDGTRHQGLVDNLDEEEFEANLSFASSVWENETKRLEEVLCFMNGLYSTSLQTSALEPFVAQGNLLGLAALHDPIIQILMKQSTVH